MYCQDHQPEWVKKLMFTERIDEQLKLLNNIPFSAKFPEQLVISMYIMQRTKILTGKNLQINL